MKCNRRIILFVSRTRLPTQFSLVPVRLLAPNAKSGRVWLATHCNLPKASLKSVISSSDNGSLAPEHSVTDFISLIKWFCDIVEVPWWKYILAPLKIIGQSSSLPTLKTWHRKLLMIRVWKSGVPTHRKSSTCRPAQFPSFDHIKRAGSNGHTVNPALISSVLTLRYHCLGASWSP